MTVYLCELCDFVTDHKTKFMRHNKTKKHIRNEEQHQQQQKLLQQHQQQHCHCYNHTYHHSNHSNHSTLNNNTSKSVDEKPTYPCNYCGKIYAHRQGRSRHQKVCSHSSKSSKSSNSSHETKPQTSDMNTIEEEHQHEHEHEYEYDHEINMITNIFASILYDLKKSNKMKE